MRAFDELDDEELRGGGSIDCLVSVLDASTLGGSLQINGEGCASILTLWDRCCQLFGSVLGGYLSATKVTSSTLCTGRTLR